MPKAVDVDDADVVGADVLPYSDVADSPAAVQPGCDCRLVDIAVAVDTTENEATKKLDAVKCRDAKPRAAAMRRFLVIIIFNLFDSFCFNYPLFLKLIRQ